MGLFDDNTNNFRAKAKDVFDVRFTNFDNISFFKLISSPRYPKDMNFFKALFDDISWSIFRLNIGDFIDEYKTEEITPISSDEFVNTIIRSKLQNYIEDVNNLCRKPFYHDVYITLLNTDEKSSLYSVWFEWGKKHKKTREFNLLVKF